ncbi:hypothetical protein BSK56_20620 [Paenibacillus borealis]|uniref:Uncharacterized protein n=1 Tax=Paenibacillus borealis TaxID=160799 RepID=A0ABX3H7E2_PAEBO|nr:hypothetical protein BSK56_20620 [Paenibacillus borealis]
MPGVKKLHQELENSANRAYFFGHCFSAIRLLLGTSRKWFCLLLIDPALRRLNNGTNPAAPGWIW